MSDLPYGWVRANLRQLGIEIRSGFPSGRHNQVGEGIPHLRPMNVNRNGEIDLSDVKFVSPDVNELRLSPGDVLFNNTNSPVLVGKTAHFDRMGDYAFSNHMTRLRTPEGIESKFVAHQLHYLWMTGRFQAMCAHHVNQASVSGGALAKRPTLVVPPPGEQRRIVAAIDEQFSRLDAATACLVRAERNLMRLRRSALADAFTSHGWPLVPIRELARVSVGTTPSRKRSELWNGTVPWVSSGEVAFSRISTTRERITEEALGDRAKRLHPVGTVLLAMIGEGKTRGQAAILDVPAAHNQNSAAIRSDPEILSPEFLFYFFMSRYEETRLLGSGNNQQALNKARVEAILVPTPLPDEQGAAVAEIERQLSVIDKLTTTVAASIERGDAIRRQVLQRAFSGGLVFPELQDPSVKVELRDLVAGGSGITASANIDSAGG